VVKRKEFFRARSRGVLRVLAYVGLLIYFTLLAGKALYLPVALAISSGSGTVVPRWDLVFGLAEYVSRPANGSRVLACFPEAWATACFTGYYVSNGNGRWVDVIGYSNGFLRVGLNGNGVRVYSVALTAPYTVWVPVLALYLTYLAYELVGSIRLGYRLPLRDPRVAGLALLLALSLNAILVGALYVDQATPRYSAPGIGVRWSFDLESSTLTAELDLGGIYTLVSASCSLRPEPASNNGGSSSGNYVFDTRIVGGSTVVVVVPRYVYEHLYSTVVLKPVPPVPANLSYYTALPVSCTFRLDKGVLQATFLAEFYWRDLAVSVDGALVRVGNPNPVRVGARAFVMDLNRGSIVGSLDLELEPLGAVELDLSGYGPGRYRVVVQYTLLGLGRSRVAYVEVP